MCIYARLQPKKMRVVSAFIFDEGGCRYVQDLNFVPYFNRSSVSELMHELVRVAVERMDDMRKIYVHDPWQVIAMRAADTKLVLVTDIEYPVQVAYELLSQLCRAPELLNTVLENCQDPRTVSATYRVRQQLGETLVIMHENVDKVLGRGENIAELVEKSERLSASSKAFYKVARAHNTCCLIS